MNHHHSWFAREGHETVAGAAIFSAGTIEHEKGAIVGPRVKREAEVGFPQRSREATVVSRRQSDPGGPLVPYHTLIREHLSIYREMYFFYTPALKSVRRLGLLLVHIGVI